MSHTGGKILILLSSITASNTQELRRIDALRKKTEESKIAGIIRIVMSIFRNYILWIDCLGGLAVGVLVLLIYPWLSRLENLPEQVVVSMGMANLIYGSYSLFVTTRNPRSTGLVKFLAIANMTWLPVCLGVAVFWSREISTAGTILVLGEGTYVAVLGIIEWKLRTQLPPFVREEKSN